MVEGFDSEESFVYGTDGKVLFEYNGNNKVTEYYNRQVVGSANKFKSSAVFTWKGDNLSILEDSFEDGTIEDTENLFDDKVNPLNEIYTKYLKFPCTKLEYASKNNITATKKLFEGTRYKIESTYVAKQNVLSQKVFIFKNTEWVEIGQNIFENYQ